MRNDSSNYFSKFQNDKDNYELEKTLILQKDETKRLKDELTFINSHIKDTKKHFRQIILIHKKKVKSLKKEIESIPTSTSIIRSNLISTHTKAISKLKHDHHLNLKEIRKQYFEQINLFKISEMPSQLFLEETSNYDQLNDAYIYQNFKNTEAYEIEIQSKIQVINQQIATQLLKSEELQDEIDKMKEIIKNDRLKSLTYKSMNKKFQINQQNGQIQDRFQQNSLIQKRYQEDVQSFENKKKYDEANVKKKFNDDLDQLRLKINQIRKKSQEMKLKIEDKYTDSSPELNESIQSLTNLQEVYQQMQNVSNNQVFIEKDIRVNKKILKQTLIQLNISIGDLEEAKKEHNSLLEEIKRLDFMVYGRKGRFQRIFKVKKKNYWTS